MNNIVLSSASAVTSSTFGFIKKNSATSGHGKWLMAKGYTVSVEEHPVMVEKKLPTGEKEEVLEKASFWKVEVLGFVPEVEISREALTGLAQARQALTYGSAGTIDGEVKKGLNLCWALGPASALVMMTEAELRAKAEPKKAKKAKKDGDKGPHRFDF